MCVGTGGPRGGAKTQEKETQKQNDLEGLDRQTDRQTVREQWPTLLSLLQGQRGEEQNALRSEY